MTLTKFKAFLNSGAFLQLTPDTFNLVLGPFEPVTFSDSDISDTNSLQNPIIYKPDFWDFTDGAQSQMLRGSEAFVVTREQFSQLLSEVECVQAIIKWQEPMIDIFEKQFRWSQQKFESSELKKAVPVTAQSAATTFGLHQLAYSLKYLIGEDHFGWGYGFWQDEVGFVGQSPERLVEWNSENKALITTALAGTVAATPGAEQQLINDEKNLEEHQFVVQDIQTKIKAVQQTEISTSKTDVVKLKYLFHLKTEFQIEANTVDTAFQILNALHPTAALGLYPPIAAEYTNLRQLQTDLNRKNFAAPFCFMTSERLFAVAAIRSLYFTNDSIKIFSGCGVTSRSQFENELAEVTNKRNSVVKMMGLEA